METERENLMLSFHLYWRFNTNNKLFSNNSYQSFELNQYLVYFFHLDSSCTLQTCKDDYMYIMRTRDLARSFLFETNSQQLKSKL